MRLAKLVVRHGAETDQRTGLLLERLAQSLLYASDEKAEGAGAFLEKRPARFPQHDDRHPTEPGRPAPKEQP